MQKNNIVFLTVLLLVNLGFLVVLDASYNASLERAVNFTYFVLETYCK